LNWERFVKTCCFLFSLGVFGCIENSWSAIYYVDQNHGYASDLNTGTGEDAPWLTLDHATDIAVAGDTVIVKAGNYIDTDQPDQYTSFNTVNSGSHGLPITFKSEPPLAAVIKSKSLPANTDYYAWAINNRSYITIDAFKFEGGFIFDGGSSNCLLKNSELVYGRVPPADPTLNWGAAIGNSSSCTISNVYVHDMRDSGNHEHNTAAIMVCFNSSNNIIEYCTADAGNGIVYSAFGQKGGNLNGNIWRWNLALNANAAFLGMGSTNNLLYCDDNVFHNNVTLNVKTVVELDHNCRRNIIYNNTAHNITRFLGAGSEVTDTELWNNIVSSFAFSIYGGTKLVFDSSAVTPPDLLKYSDYNLYYLLPDVFARIQWEVFADTLLNWRSITMLDLSSKTESPYFSNINGVTSSDYKRLSYVLDGRGNPYANVMGAFITGQEQIGYTPVDADTIAPIISTVSPGSVLSFNITSINLTVETNEESVCKYSTIGNIAYESMGSTFTTTGNTSHSSTIYGLVNGATYQYFIRCSDVLNNKNTSDYIIDFSVSAQEIAAPSCLRVK